MSDIRKRAQAYLELARNFYEGVWAAERLLEAVKVLERIEKLTRFYDEAVRAEVNYLARQFLEGTGKEDK